MSLQELYAWNAYFQIKGEREEQAMEGISIQLNEFQSAYKNYEIRFDSLEQLSQTFNYQ